MLEDAELLPIYAIAWLPSLLRVLQALLRGEALSVDVGSAVIVAVVVPVLGRSALSAWIRRGRTGGGAS